MTKPSLAGSPAATPRLNGNSRKIPPSARRIAGAARPARVAPARNWRRLNMAGLSGGGSPPLIAQPYVSSLTDAGREQNNFRAIHSAKPTNKNGKASGRENVGKTV